MILWDLLRLRCPVCRQGKVFAGPYSMNRSCPKCGVEFERENGYFMGAMVLAYLFGCMSIIPTIVVLVMRFDADMAMVIGIPIAQLILLQPLLYIYSRMAWMYIDRNVSRKNWE